MTKLRFAPLIRVSGEKQDKQGESLRTQKAQVIEYVKSLNGIIPNDCWKYSGQESASVGKERQNLESLLQDSFKGVFDAIIVCDVSRWSRDNEKSKQGLKIFKQNGIRFFVGTTEYDLTLPQHTLFLGMSTEMNEFFSLEQGRKALINRIARAKRGVPTAGKLPYGRTFDKKTETWGLDLEKVKKIEQAAEDYLNGKKFHDIALKQNLNIDHLHKIFRNSCGDEFPIRFRSKQLNIDESVILKVPRLLSEEKIKEIKEQTQANMTYNHDQRTHKYLLGRMIFCGHCGHAMHGTAWNYKDTKRKYYVHMQRSGKNEIDCKVLKDQKYVKAKDIDDAVMIHLFQMFGDVSSIEKALKKSIPDFNEIKALRVQKESLLKELSKNQNNKEKIVIAISKGIISDDDALKQMTKFKKRDTLLNQEIESIDLKTQNVPTEKQIKQKTDLIKRTIKSSFTNYQQLGDMTFDDKRALLQSVFSGKDSEGKRLGVYLTRDNGIHYIINGGFKKISGKLPMTRDEALEILQVETDYDPDFDPTKSIIRSQDQRFIVKILPQRVISFKLQGKFKIASAS